jgi:DNA helicase-2/ATP-dependent DNA helicase PcrA
LQGFFSLVEHLAEKVTEMSLAELIEEVIIRSGLPEHYLKEGREKAQNRRENLTELCSAAVQFTEHLSSEDQDISPLTAFLSHTSLETDVDRENKNDPKSVQLMTLHSAKGLEFPVVFLAGLEEDLFPHKLSKEEPGRLEEERRLCYVGMTRARQKLFMTYAQRRRLYGNDNYAIPSRFLSELPKELLHHVNPDLQVWKPASSQASAQNHHREAQAYPLGQRVFHANYGEGVVTDYEGHGHHTRIQVHFDLTGSKWLPFEYAKLQPLI